MRLKGLASTDGRLQREAHKILNVWLLLCLIVRLAVVARSAAGAGGHSKGRGEVG